jgi:gentisate 1,2-dioxygenase
VPTGTVQVVQQCGKFAFFANEGCHFVNPFIGQAVAGTISTRVQSLDVSVETKTKDNVFVMIVVSVRDSRARAVFFAGLVSRLASFRSVD